VIPDEEEIGGRGENEHGQGQKNQGNQSAA